MQAVATSSPFSITASSSVPAIEYSLKEGRVEVSDRTNRLAKVVFSRELTEEYEEPAYEILVKGKKVVDPNWVSGGLSFVRSLRITFQMKGDFIEVTERDANGVTTLYIDPREEVLPIHIEAYKTYFCIHRAYVAYPYEPMEISLEDAQQKIRNIRIKFPHFNFTGAVALYNRHGVAVFGYEMGKYVLYWANPSEEGVKKVDCTETGCLRIEDKSIAASRDGNVNFIYWPFARVFCLNGASATILALEQSSETSHSSTLSSPAVATPTERKEAKS